MSTTTVEFLKSRSIARIALIVITIINVFRIPSVFAKFTLPNLPVYEWIPGWGDTIAGVLAIGVAYMLLRHRGLLVWTLAIVWNVYGMLDVINAGVLRVLMPQVDTPSALPAGLSGPILITTLHLVSLFLLGQSIIREYYLGRRDAVS